MRAALSILGLVIVLAIVMVNIKQQAKSLAPQAASGASAPAATAPQAVGQQVQGLLDQAAAQRASEANP